MFWPAAAAAASPSPAIAMLDLFRPLPSAEPDKELILSDSSLLFVLSLPDDSPSLLEGRDMIVATGLPMIVED